MIKVKAKVLSKIVFVKKGKLEESRALADETMTLAKENNIIEHKKSLTNQNCSKERKKETKMKLMIFPKRTEGFA